MISSSLVRELVVAAVNVVEDVDGKDLSNAVVEFDRWLMQVKAEAWDEGFAEGLDDGCSCDGCLKWVSNPYREDLNE